jgi:hypothetical protein
LFTISTFFTSPSLRNLKNLEGVVVIPLEAPIPPENKLKIKTTTMTMPYTH